MFGKVKVTLGALFFLAGLSYIAFLLFPNSGMPLSITWSVCLGLFIVKMKNVWRVSK